MQKLIILCMFFNFCTVLKTNSVEFNKKCQEVLEPMFDHLEIATTGQRPDCPMDEQRVRDWIVDQRALGNHAAADTAALTMHSMDRFNQRVRQGQIPLGDIARFLQETMVLVKRLESIG